MENLANIPDLADSLNAELAQAIATCPGLACIPHATELREVSQNMNTLGP